MYLGRLLQGSTWYKVSAKLTPPGSGCPLPLGSPPGDASGARPSCLPPQSCWRAISEELLVISRPGWDSKRRTSTLLCTWSASSASCSVVPRLPCPRLPLAPPRTAIALWPNRWRAPPSSWWPVTSYWMYFLVLYSKPCCFSVSCIVVCICSSRTPNLSLTHLLTHKFVFCVCESVYNLSIDSLVFFKILYINDIM